MTYKIIRFYARGEKEVIRRGLTLEEAQEHCSDPSTNSLTNQNQTSQQRVKEKGHWFDSYTEE